MNASGINKLEDNQLASLLQQGNRHDFNEIYNRFWKLLFNYTFNILQDTQLTEDVLHEVFLKIWINRQTSNIQNMKAYLINASRNNAISKIRQAKWTNLQEETIKRLSGEPDIELQLDEADLRKEIDQATAALPKRCREIFYMSRFEHLSIQEIADKLNVSHRTVENQISTALKHIRRTIPNSLYCVLLVAMA